LTGPGSGFDGSTNIQYPISKNQKPKTNFGFRIAPACPDDSQAGISDLSSVAFSHSPTLPFSHQSAIPFANLLIPTFYYHAVRPNRFCSPLAFETWQVIIPSFHHSNIPFVPKVSLPEFGVSKTEPQGANPGGLVVLVSCSG
jgi:hypothetical protein